MDSWHLAQFPSRCFQCYNTTIKRAPQLLPITILHHTLTPIVVSDFIAAEVHTPVAWNKNAADAD